MTDSETTTCRTYSLGIDLRGNTRFPEAYEVTCVVEWDVRRELEELRQMAADFYGVPVEQVRSCRETPLSVARREGALLCGRPMIGLGDDTYDPVCELTEGHDGRCKSSSATVDGWKL